MANLKLVAVFEEGDWSVASRMLDMFQRNHGAKAAAGDLERAEALQATIRESGVVGAE